MAIKPLVELRRPAPQNLGSKWDRHRVDQHINDNIDRLNTAFAYFEQEFVHGEEALFPNPFGVSSIKQPIALFSGVAEDEDGNALGIASYKISAPRTDGQVGITVEYDLRHTEPCMVRTASATQSLTNDTDTLFTGWDTLAFSRGSIISYDGTGTFTVSEAGSYAVSATMGLQSGVTYSSANLYSSRPAVGVWGNSFIPAAFSDRPFLVSSDIITGPAGMTITIRGAQANGAGAARNLLAGRRVTIHRLYNDSTPTGTVRGYLLAGA